MTVVLDNQYEIDEFNNRCVCYLIDASKSSINYLLNLEKDQNVSKTIIYTLQKNVEILGKYGFNEEGIISQFFLGKDGYILTKYQGTNRKNSGSTDRNQQILEIAANDQKVFSNVDLDDKFELGLATEKDADALASLYKKVFKYYPTNVHDPEYIRKIISEKYFFITIKHNDHIVSAASAMIKPEYKSAEITDCATDPHYRGNNLMYSIILEIEQELLNRSVRTFFSLTRAQSPAMNLTVKRLGYRYEGTLINNCKIYSGFEDMNIWTKSAG